MKALEEIDRADLCDNLSPDIDSLARLGQVTPLDFRGYAFCRAKWTRCQDVP